MSNIAHMDPKLPSKCRDVSWPSPPTRNLLFQSERPAPNSIVKLIINAQFISLHIYLDFRLIVIPSGDYGAGIDKWYRVNCECRLIARPIKYGVQFRSCSVELCTAVISI